MSLTFEKSGILTTIQDLGRFGHRRFGVNPSGVMDRTAARLINILVGNAENDAVIEMHFPAPQISFEANAIIAIGGADLSPAVDGHEIQNWRAVFVKKGSTLRFSNKALGSRAYLAVASGFAIEPWLGSHSTNLAAGLGGLDGRKIAIGDRVSINQRADRIGNFASGSVSSSLVPTYSRFPTLRIVTGAEFDELSEQGRDSLTTQNFVLSPKSDRMGYRLIGEPLPIFKHTELISSAVAFGTIQLLPDGQLIVLMADHQTTGGYPRVAHVVGRDLPLLAQLDANDKVAFHLVSHSEAERLAIEFERELKFFRIGCRFQAQSWK